MAGIESGFHATEKPPERALLIGLERADFPDQARPIQRRVRMVEPEEIDRAVVR